MQLRSPLCVDEFGHRASGDALAPVGDRPLGKSEVNRAGS